MRRPPLPALTLAVLLAAESASAAITLRAVDGEGQDVDLAKSHASFQRTPPDRLGDDPFGDNHDPDALRFVLIATADEMPGTVTIASLDESGAELDTLRDVPLGHSVCPVGTAPGLICGSTRPIRAVADDIDRNHPTTLGRSLRAELGGALIVFEGEQKLGAIRVLGPRASSLGPIERHRARLAVRIVRVTPGGAPPMGVDDQGAIALAKTEVERANGLWAACGISFGPTSELDVRVVDPPGPHLLAIGCDQGLPASGGEIRVLVDGKPLVIAIAPGMRPDAAARRVAATIEGAGFSVRVSDNARIGGAAFGSSDVLVRRRDGALATLSQPATGPVSSDATLTACVGKVSLEDGLQHFGDADAIAGTVEERTLIKAFDDGDPSTIEVLMLPSFAGGGRIGESFIYADGGAIRNVVIEDRAGIRAERSSFTLAHELGHVLLDDPGHPDDFGVDTPTRLMDADSANGSAYGPRRLLVSECERAIRQSGPGSTSETLRAWPVSPMPR